MDIKEIDFNSRDEAGNCLKELLPEDAFSYKQISNLNHLSKQKSFSKQFNNLTYYVSLRTDQFHARIILTDNFLLLDKNCDLEHKIKSWGCDKLIHNPYDFICLLGFEALEKVQNKIESLETFIDTLEEVILEKPDKSQQVRIFKLHRKAIRLKRQINEYLTLFIRMKQNTPLWDDLVMNVQSELDNSRQLVELMENLREAYQSSMDNKSNDIMKFLTILATVLLPINILTSFFGMNFDGMPLIHDHYGIFIFYLIITFLVLIIALVFKRKKWF